MGITNKLTRFATGITFGWCLLTTSISQAEESVAIPTFTAHYQLLRNDNMKVGEVKRTTTTNDSGAIEFESYSKTTGLAALFIKDKITERTTFTIANNIIQPQNYLYDRTGGKRTREAKLNFDWTKKSVTNAINGEAWHMDIQPGTQDKLSYQLQLMLDLQAGITEFDYLVADGGTLKKYRFTLLGEETIKTSLGDIKTIKLKRERAADSKRKTTIWFARSLHYLPVRIKQGKSDDEFVTLEIKQVEGI